MRKSVMFLACAVSACVLAACSAGGSSSGTSEDLSNIPDSQVLLEASSPGVDYDAVASVIGPILHAAEWEKPSDIPVEELLDWYIRYVSEEYIIDPEYMTRYEVEGSDELHIPAGEFENAAFTFFGLESAYLQEMDAYHESGHFYAVPAAAEDADSISCSVTRVTIKGNEAAIYFDLAAGEEEPIIGMLTIEKNSSGFKAISCLQVESDELEEEEPGESVKTETTDDAETSEAAPDDASQEDI